MKICKLEAFLDKYYSDTLEMSDLKQLNIHLGVGDIVCYGIAEGEEQIAGLKYMIHVLPAMWDYSIQCKKKFTQEFIEETIKKVIDKFGVEHSDFFTNKELNVFYRDRTMIQKHVDNTIGHIKKMDVEEWNPLM